MSDDIHPLALRDVMRDDSIPLPKAIETLKQIANTFCFDRFDVVLNCTPCASSGLVTNTTFDAFDVSCPICGQMLVEGDRHECRLVTGPCECEAQGAPTKCGAC